MGLAGAHAAANGLEAPLGAGMFVGTYSYPGPQSGLLGGSDTVTLHSTGRQRPQGGRGDIFLVPLGMATPSHIQKRTVGLWTS